MDMLGLRKTVDQLATGDEVRRYIHRLRRDDNSALRTIDDNGVDAGGQIHLMLLDSL